MRITEKKLADAGCCQFGVDKYFKDIGRKQWVAEKLIAECIKRDDFEDCAYAISRLMEKHQRVEWAIYSAERVISIYEKEYPDDNMPRKAIEAAKKCLKNPSAAAYVAADAAAYAAAANAAAANAATANAANAARAAADAANAAAFAAADAADAAYAAAAYAATAFAAARAADAAAYANKNIKARLLKRGLYILKRKST